MTTMSKAEQRAAWDAHVEETRERLDAWRERPHPEWCNKRHQPGASPKRQHHLHTWRPTGDGADKVEIYVTSLGDPSMSIRVYDGLTHVQNRPAWIWISAEDALSLGERLVDFAQMALRGEA